MPYTQPRDPQQPPGQYWMGGKIYKARDCYTDAVRAEVVVFDIADQQFNFYSKAQFEDLIGQYRNELEEDGYDTQHMDFDDVIEAIHGDELWWDLIPLVEE